jgi:putative ATP-dependent endonuclease of OLD family
MLLKNLLLTNFRCFNNLPTIPIHKLTIFIGENDSGKTAIIDALQILLTNQNPSSSDYRILTENQQVDKIVIGGNFELEAHDSVPEDYITIDGRELVLTKTFTQSNVIITVNGRGFPDYRWSSFPRQNAQIQRELLESIGISPGSNIDQRIEQFEVAVASKRLTKIGAELEIHFSDIAEFLPRFELVASTDYRHPDTMVQRTFQAVVNSFLRPEDPKTGERELLPELQELKRQIKNTLDNEITKIFSTLKRTNPKLVNIQVSPEIDFARSISATNLMVDVGEGLRFINSVGEGTKKKLWLGLLDWESETQHGLQDVSVIRAYDEPDVNLDYAAERKLFDTILESTRSADSRTQALVSTHAVTLVDRAPGKSINLIKVGIDGTRHIQYLTGARDIEIERFLSTIGRSVGLTNSALFYERSFLVVEGESEENSLPILYRNLYGKSLIEDGIVLISLFSCGAWKAMLHILQLHKSEITVMLLDQDCTSPDSCTRLTPEALAEIGFPIDYLRTSCFLIGMKEYEDAFSTSDIIAVLDIYWPKQNGDRWVEDDINQFRDVNRKFSEDLLQCVRRICIPAQRNSVRKPEFAEKLAQHCRKEQQIPLMIRRVFQEARTRSGLIEV